MKHGHLALLAAALLFWGGAALAQGHIERADDLDQIKPGVTTAAEVEKLLGKPGRTMHFPRQGTDVMEYNGRDTAGRFYAQIAITQDGKVRDVQRIRPSIP